MGEGGEVVFINERKKGEDGWVWNAAVIKRFAWP